MLRERRKKKPVRKQTTKTFQKYIIKCKVPDQHRFISILIFIYKRNQADSLFTSVLLANKSTV